MSAAGLQGELWGTHARDWAMLQEPKHADIWEAMLDAANVGAGTAVVDLGCGGGGASKLASQRGAQVSGLDASPELITIAQEQVPEGDFRVGDLEDLPYAADSFDVGLAANSIQFAGNAVNALTEMARVCRSEGLIAASVWGMPEDCDTRHVFEAVLGVLPEKPSGGGPFALSMPGILDDLMHRAGMTPTAEQVVAAHMTFPDLATAWRAMRSAGPLQGAVRAVGEEPVRQAVCDVLQRFQGPTGEVSMRNQFKVVVASV